MDHRSWEKNIYIGFCREWRHTESRCAFPLHLRRMMRLCPLRQERIGNLLTISRIRPSRRERDMDINSFWHHRCRDADNINDNWICMSYVSSDLHIGLKGKRCQIGEELMRFQRHILPTGQTRIICVRSVLPIWQANTRATTLCNSEITKRERQNRQ